MCKELIRTRRSRFATCNAEAPEHTLFYVGGHLQSEVRIPHDSNLHRRLQIEADRLYYARRQPIWIGTAIASREAEGKPVEHLREQMSMNRNYVRALVSALDNMGWLGPVERICRRLENQYG